MFRKKHQDTTGWQLVAAEVLGVEYGPVVYATRGVGTVESLSSSQRVKLLLRPADGEPYEAVLRVGRKSAGVPDVIGTTFELLVDPADRMHLVLPADVTYTLPGGKAWPPKDGLAAALAEAARRGDAAEIMRLNAEIQRRSLPPEFQ